MMPRIRKALALCVIVFALALFASGCAPAAGGCTPNQTVTCVCSSGAMGSQTCNASGTGFVGACAGCGSASDGGCTRFCDGVTCGGDDGCGQACGCSAGNTCAGGTCVPVSSGCASSCSAGYRCQGTSCQLDPASQWVIVAVRATVGMRDCTDSSWDVPGGLPDPRVCEQVSGQWYCTPAVDDTLNATWSAMNASPPIGVSSLLGGIDVALEDVDVTSNETVCAGTVTFTEADFLNGQKTITCGPCSGTSYSPGSMTFRIEAR